MNSFDNGEETEETLHEKKRLLQCVKTEEEENNTNGEIKDKEKMQSFLVESLGKRAALQMTDGLTTEMDQSSSRKRVKVYVEEGRRAETAVSYRKPLYGISHRITEKKTTSGMDHYLQHEAGSRQNCNNHLFPKLTIGEANRRESNTTSPGCASAAVENDSHLYSLIEKMFFILNTLNSSMTQLHSKVDLLSLEVSRIKRRMNSSELMAEFQPPPEYQLTGEELRQLADQTSSPGELGCRLLLQLFPELFTTEEYSQSCTGGVVACKRTLHSLQLQLIRNYVEFSFPFVKNGNSWQSECLPQINDFFNRFWAQKDMESVATVGRQTPIELEPGFEVDQEESLTLENANDINITNGGPNPSLAALEASEDMDDPSSPADFAVFLMHRLFPEVFEEGKLPEGNYSSGGKIKLDSDRLDIIRKYMEKSFPDVAEESWLQLCIQRVEEVLESVQANGNDSENARDESYDSASLPDDASVIKLGDLSEFDRPSRRSKKTNLAPVDFDKMDIPAPDFEVPQEYMLSREQLRSIYDSSLSIGNFASRLLVLMFPELFTYENARKHYNCSGSLGKKQLDPVRITLIRHYVQLLYPPAKNDRVWTLEFVGKLDERCRRRDTEQRRSYQQQRKVYAPESEAESSDVTCQPSQLAQEHFKEEEFEIPPLPPEKSNKDFCKIPLEELSVNSPEFPVPSIYLLSDAEIREVVQQSLSVGNFAARLLVRLFPELFTQENLRLQYNHSGACNKKQLDPVRLRLIRHYVEAVYPVDKIEEVWHYECVPSIDERCRRPNRKKCDILKKAKRTNSVSYL